MYTETRTIGSRRGHRRIYNLYIYIIHVGIRSVASAASRVEWRSRASCKRSITGARHRGFPMAVICH